eukprot:1161791-Pelagomonas_calceolata.AAC.3
MHREGDWLRVNHKHTTLLFLCPTRRHSVARAEALREYSPVAQHSKNTALIRTLICKATQYRKERSTTRQHSRHMSSPASTGGGTTPNTLAAHSTPRTPLCNTALERTQRNKTRQPTHELTCIHRGGDGPCIEGGRGNGSI